MESGCNRICHRYIQLYSQYNKSVFVDITNIFTKISMPYIVHAASKTMQSPTQTVKIVLCSRSTHRPCISDGVCIREAFNKKKTFSY